MFDKTVIKEWDRREFELVETVVLTQETFARTLRLACSNHGFTSICCSRVVRSKMSGTAVIRTRVQRTPSAEDTTTPRSLASQRTTERGLTPSFRVGSHRGVTHRSLLNEHAFQLDDRSGVGVGVADQVAETDRRAVGGITGE